MGANNHRGEISHIGDDLFINYTLELPEEELASTSGYFMKGSPFRYSYFTVERGATSKPQQATEVYEVDHTSGNKSSKRLAALTWSSGGSKEICLGLITGYTLPKEWEPFIEMACFSCYVSAASINKRGIGRNKKGQIDLHTSRIQELDGAELVLYLPTLPDGVTVNDLQVFVNSHAAQQSVHHHPPGAAAPGPVAVPATLAPAINSLVIGGSGQPLQTGLYVIAKPIGRGNHHHQQTTQQPGYGHHAT